MKRPRPKVVGTVKRQTTDLKMPSGGQKDDNRDQVPAQLRRGKPGLSKVARSAAAKRMLDPQVYKRTDTAGYP